MRGNKVLDYDLQCSAVKRLDKYDYHIRHIPFRSMNSLSFGILLFAAIGIGMGTSTPCQLAGLSAYSVYLVVRQKRLFDFEEA